ncbi:MAG: N,N-dimethylformamidase large subunit [Rhodospirillaceae bacterium]|nr:N,N-dimethylformamidase large subunit [Rhodospirillaceae bacterium]
MTRIMGYADRVSLQPGETVRIMASCIGAKSYRAEIVRLLSPNAGMGASEYREVTVETPANATYPAREQKMHAGSFGVVPEKWALKGVESFTLQAYVWPTTPKKGPRAIMGTWAASGSGYGLSIDAEGAAEIRIGAFKLASGVPMLERRWYLVAASFDAKSGQVRLWQEPIYDKSFHAERPVMVEGKARASMADAGAPFLFAAWRSGEAPSPTVYGNMLTTGHFNGRIDRPRLARKALDRAQIQALTAGMLPSGLEEEVLGFWDFAKDISSQRITDLSPNRLDGEVVNVPARAVTGHNWTGSEMNWTKDPQQYGAIHFHDDDISDAKWQPDFSFTVPKDAKSGFYAAKLTSDEAYFYCPFFVRPTRGTANAKIAFLASTATYTVYANNRGRFTKMLTELYQGRISMMDAVDILQFEFPEMGVSTYDRHTDSSGVSTSSRLRPVTNWKPHGRLWNYCCDLFIVDWLEHVGMPYDIITDHDLHVEGQDLLRPYNVVLTGSHPEYWSLEMLDALDGYQRQGGRHMYMGGNGFYWRIAFHPENMNIIEVRRSEDGVRAWDARVGEYYHQFTGEYGGLWRRQGRAPQVATGVGFISQGFDACSYYRRTAQAKDPRVAFMFDGVTDEILGNFGVLQGGAAGLEIDCADFALGTPPHALVVASSENHSNTYILVAEEINIGHGALDAVQNAQIRADITFFETPNGGAVFSTGSIAYAGSLPIDGFNNNIAKLTTNVLKRFAEDRPFAMPR